MKSYSDINKIDSQFGFGKPCNRGSGITVNEIQGERASGMTKLELQNDYPELTESDMQAVWGYVADRENRVNISSYFCEAIPTLQNTTERKK